MEPSATLWNDFWRMMNEGACFSHYAMLLNVINEAAWQYIDCSNLSATMKLAAPSGVVRTQAILSLVTDSLTSLHCFFMSALAGKPKLVGGWGHEVPSIGADGKQEREYWHWGDMQIVRWCVS